MNMKLIYALIYFGAFLVCVFLAVENLINNNVGEAAQFFFIAALEIKAMTSSLK